jgi:hypothetical protein
VDYFQGVVTEYLRADRATFVNTELLIQLEPGDSPAKGRHWYCDVVAVSFKDKTVHLCEVTFSKSLGALFERLNGWAANWSELRAAIQRDCRVPSDWTVQPRVFIPKQLNDTYQKKLAGLVLPGDGSSKMPAPLITNLESVLPWEYRSWDRKGDKFANDA